MVSNSTKLSSDDTEVAGGRLGRRKRITLTLVILNVLVIAICFVGLRAYGYRLKTAVRAAPFATRTPFETGTGSNPQFESQATLNADSRMIAVSGTYGCFPDEGEAVVNALVSQESTGAFGRGTFRGNCTGQLEQFVIRAIVPEGNPAFQEGRVKIEALGLNRRGTTEFTFLDFVFWGRFANAVKSSAEDQAQSTPRNR
jgi:hypothetical protein